MHRAAALQLPHPETLGPSTALHLALASFCPPLVRTMVRMGQHIMQLYPPLEAGVAWCIPIGVAVTSAARMLGLQVWEPSQAADRGAAQAERGGPNQAAAGRMRCLPQPPAALCKAVGLSGQPQCPPGALQLFAEAQLSRRLTVLLRQHDSKVIVFICKRWRSMSGLVLTKRMSSWAIQAPMLHTSLHHLLWVAPRQRLLPAQQERVIPVGC